jgi:phage antirepressor YoqD-like protein
MTHVTIANVTLGLQEYNSMRVLTMKQLADLYGCNEQHIRLNFNTNKAEHFTEGKHYFKLTYMQAVEFVQTYLLDSSKVSPNGLTLWTVRGAARHAKMLKAENVWDTFEELEDKYFKKPQVSTLPDFTNPYEAALAWAEQYKGKEEALKQLAIAAPKAAITDLIVASNKIYTIGYSGKLLGLKKELMYGWLKSLGWITKGEGDHWITFQEVIDKGYMSMELQLVANNDGESEIRPQAVVTSAGISQLANLIFAGAKDANIRIDKQG